MHGIIYNLLYKFVMENFDFQTLMEIKQQAGLEDTFHFTTKSYPDTEIQALVEAATKVLNLEKEQILEAFGKFITPELLKIYKAYIKPEWDCMDCIEQIEKTIHKVVKMNIPDADPPKLIINRESKNSISIEYSSPRKMIALGIGIIKQIAETYQEQLYIERSVIPKGTRLMVQRIPKKEAIAG